MRRPVVLFIALRYMCRRNPDRFSRFISWLSLVGITIGVIALVTVLSVMNGFKYRLEKNILELIPQAMLSSTTGSINPAVLPNNAVKLQGVNRVVALTTANVLLQSRSNLLVGVMIGIDPTKDDPLTPYLINTKQTDLGFGKYNIILGEQLAEQLSVQSGDRIRMIVPSVKQFTPMGPLPSQRVFNVIGTFFSDSEVDSYQVLVNIQDASHLMHYPDGNITSWRLSLNEPLKVHELSLQKLPKDTIWKDWRDHKGELFQAVRMEKNIMGLLFSLIIIVAAFNIITSLGMQVMEKRGEIAILKTQGMTSRQIMTVFMIQGASLGIIGALLGTVLGILVASHLNHFIPMMGILLHDRSLPVFIEPLEVIGIAIVTIAIALLSTLYPSWDAATTQPAELLRYE